MTNQEIAQKIINTDYIFPKSFSNLQYTDYGMLFYSEDYPESNDANHAIITKYHENSDFDNIIKNIKDFYLSKNIPPLIYPNRIPGQLEKIKDSLIKHGFEFDIAKDFYLLHTTECKINEPYSLKIKRIKNGDDISFVFKICKINENRRGGADRVYKIIEKRIKLPDYNLFVGYLDNGTPVTMAAIEYFDGIGMVDEVNTAEKYQGKGYARQLTRFWVDWHYKNYKNNLLYLSYNNPTAGKIYREVGFTDIDWEFESWSAWIDL